MYVCIYVYIYCYVSLCLCRRVCMCVYMYIYICICLCMCVYIYACVYVSTPMLTPGHVRVHTHLSFPCFLYMRPWASSSGGQLHCFGPCLRLNKGRFSASRILPLRLVGAILDPLSRAFQCPVHFVFIYTPGLAGCLVCTFSFVCIWFIILRVTYAAVLSEVSSVSAVRDLPHCLSPCI